MYGDSTVMRKRAAELREQAVDLRSLADHLLNQLDAVGWSGRAAASMRLRMEERGAHLRDVAGRHETAADTLARHAEETERLKEGIADAERRTARAVGDARARLARQQQGAVDGVRVEPTAHDRALLDLVPPAPGHKDWLDLDLPGT
jgi:primosomal protein N''